MESLSCCLVGYGGIAEFHADALKQIDGIRLHTLMGRRAEPARAFQQKHGFEHVTTDYDTVLAHADIDAVVITSPSEVHFEQTEKALRAGKHVLVEIPLALSHQGARDLAGLARTAGLKVLVAHTRRFDPGGIFVKDFLASGKAGQIYMHQHYSLWFRHENIGWTGYNRSWTDDVLFHHGCHLVDFSLWTVDSPVRRIRGELSPLHPKTGTSMDVSILIRYANDTMATISLSYNARQSANRNMYICENGTLSHEGKQVTFNGETVFETDLEAEGGILAQDREFFEAIRQNRSPSCNAEDGLRSLVLLQQVYDQMITLEGEPKYKRQWGV
ncbi:MAG: Gfo/Idh/MocA family oxidoreductase [bacterium]|nr:Gfo/Idh/MocA family oxidoreductase [bacterium]